MNALIINCTLKPSPEASNTEALAQVVADALAKEGVTVDEVRAVDLVAAARALAANPLPAPRTVTRAGCRRGTLLAGLGTMRS